MALASSWPAMTAMLPRTTNRRIVDLNRFMVAFLSTFHCPRAKIRQELVNLICLGVRGGALLVPPSRRICLRPGAPQLAEFSAVSRFGVLLEAMWADQNRPWRWRQAPLSSIWRDQRLIRKANNLAVARYA